MVTYSRDMLIGQWYRTEYDENGCQISEYAHISPDGSFEFTFVSQNAKGEVAEQIIELGDWGLVGDIHFTMTKSEFVDEQHYAADLADEQNYHAYKVLELTGQVFRYQHIVTQEIYQLKRIAEQAGNC